MLRIFAILALIATVGILAGCSSTCDAPGQFGAAPDASCGIPVYEGTCPKLPGVTQLGDWINGTIFDCPPRANAHEAHKSN